MLDIAQDIVQKSGLANLAEDGEVIQYEFDVFAGALAREGRCSRARARQALAKAIRLAREEAIRAHLPKPISERTIDELARPDNDAPVYEA